LDFLDRMIAEFGEHGRAVVPGFLGDTLLNALRSEIRELSRRGKLRAAAIGGGANRQVHSHIRADEIVWWDPADTSSARQECLARFEQLRQAMNLHLQLGLWEFEGHYSRYSPGAFYRRHLDQIAGETSRRVSSVLYLNDTWQPADGGALRIYLDKTAEAPYEDIVPEGGKLVLFSSDRFPHEVLPSGRERYSLAGWFRVRP
jgi:SM-20-related protein